VKYEADGVRLLVLPDGFALIEIKEVNLPEYIPFCFESQVTYLAELNRPVQKQGKITAHPRVFGQLAETDSPAADKPDEVLPDDLGVEDILPDIKHGQVFF